MKDYRKEISLRDGRKVVLRSPDPADARLILDWFTELVAEDTFIAAPPSAHVTLEDEERFLQNMLGRVESGDALHLYAQDSRGRFVGHMGIDRQGGRHTHCAELATSVSKDWRDCGLGTALMRAHLSEIHRLDLRMLFLGVLANNPRAIHLYAKFGFRECGRRPEYALYKGKFVDLIEMFLPVSDIKL
ncbi:MAG: GNAT family N-acetyltransferase [Chloroflexi bacterium]|nr:GNAT family N-acetyltransferase [Chloroflexota bacterium]MCY3938131.1 GNAT family N-acetyltransferase [Chloroflexota bacterium]